MRFFAHTHLVTSKKSSTFAPAFEKDISIEDTNLSEKGLSTGKGSISSTE